MTRAARCCNHCKTMPSKTDLATATRGTTSDVLIWDNASVQHRASGDFAVGEPRRFWRYMVEGPVPVALRRVIELSEPALDRSIVRRWRG